MNGQTMQTDWLAKWSNAKKYTIALAETMPDSLYGWRPTYPAPEVDSKPALTFGEQLTHLARNIEWLSTSKLRDGETPPKRELDPNNKTAVLAYLNEAFGRGVEALEGLTVTDLEKPIDWFTGEQISRRRVGLLLFDHVTHHRAQALVYVRLCGYAAPAYVGW